MNVDAIIQMIFQLLTTSLGAAKNAGLVGNPEWLKYAESGISLAGKAAMVLRDVFKDPGKYDGLSAEQIKSLLMPLTWEQIEQQAAADISHWGPPPPPPPSPTFNIGAPEPPQQS